MNKEIQEFQESFFFGLSMRQCFFSVLAIAAAVGVYLGTKDTCGTEIAGWLSVFAAAPFAGCGFFRYHQMTLEKFVWVWLKSEILCPKKLVFQSENLYLKCLEETIEIGTRSCRNGTELVERKRSKNRKKKGRLATYIQMETALKQYGTGKRIMTIKKDEINVLVPESGKKIIVSFIEIMEIGTIKEYCWIRVINQLIFIRKENFVIGDIEGI